MSDANYNPFLKRNAPAPPPEAAIPPVVQGEEPAEYYDGEHEGEELAEDSSYSTSLLPFQFALDGNDRFSPTPRLSSFRLTLVLSLIFSLSNYVLDIRQAYTQSPLPQKT